MIATAQGMKDDAESYASAWKDNLQDDFEGEPLRPEPIRLAGKYDGLGTGTAAGLMQLDKDEAPATASPSRQITSYKTGGKSDNQIHQEKLEDKAMETMPIGPGDRRFEPLRKFKANNPSAGKKEINDFLNRFKG